MLRNVSRKDLDTSKEILSAFHKVALVNRDTLKSGENSRYLFRVRLAVVYLLREHTELTYDAIGPIIGRDRSSVFRMKKRADVLVQKAEPKFWELLEQVKGDFWREAQ